MFARLKILSNVFMKKIDKIETVANKCLKVRAAVSQCSACKDVCPTESIEILEDSIEIKDSCLTCGVCTTVCQTNALKWNHPPITQLLNQLKRLSVSEADVYIGCAKSLKGSMKMNVVTVPCLGVLPSEFWISVGKNLSNLKIIYQPSNCISCDSRSGERIFLNQRNEAEKTLSTSIPLAATYELSKSDDNIDYNRRRLFTSLIEDAKEVNSITVKEVLEVENIMSPFEKFDQYYQQKSGGEELIETAQELKVQVIDKLLNERIMHTDKRAILHHEFQVHPDLQKQMTFSFPDINEGCSRCGACAFLCPTGALTMDDQSMILATNKCVSCGLCEEICYEKHIQLNPRDGQYFNEKYVYLLR